MSVFWRTYVGAADRFAEVLCGLVMILTFTLAGNIYGADVRDIVIGATGCALAWGVIDGVTLVLNALFQRGWRNTLIRNVKHADAQRAKRYLAKEFDESLGRITSTEDRDRIYSSFIASAHSLHPEPLRIVRADVYALVGLITIEALCSLFVIVPVLVLGETREAIRVSNIALVIMLFLVGYDRARRNKWSVKGCIGTGVATMSVGIALVAIAILMGG